MVLLYIVYKLSLKKNAMQTVNIHESKSQLSRLIALAGQGEPFIIAKAGKPLLKVVALNTPNAVGWASWSAP